MMRPTPKPVPPKPSTVSNPRSGRVSITPKESTQLNSTPRRKVPQTTTPSFSRFTVKTTPPKTSNNTSTRTPIKTVNKVVNQENKTPKKKEPVGEVLKKEVKNEESEEEPSINEESENKLVPKPANVNEPKIKKLSSDEDDFFSADLNRFIKDDESEEESENRENSQKARESDQEEDVVSEESKLENKFKKLNLQNLPIMSGIGGTGGTIAGAVGMGMGIGPTKKQQADEDNLSAYSDGFSYVHDILRLEGELKSKEHQLSGLIQQTAKLERNLSKRDENLFELTAELHRSSELILQLEQDNKDKDAQIEALKKEIQQEIAKNESLVSPGALNKRNKQNEKAHKKIEAEFQSAKYSPGSRNAPGAENNLPEDLYHYAINLDNQLAEKERFLNELRKENQELQRRNRELESLYKKSTKEVTEYKNKTEEYKLEFDRIINEKISTLSKNEEKLLAELRSLRSTERIKSKRLEELEQTIKNTGDLKKIIGNLETDIKTRDKKILDLNKKMSQLNTQLNQRNLQLQKFTDKQKGIPFHLWVNDRDRLQSKIEKLKLAKEKNTKTIEAQRRRIMELCERVDLIASSLQNFDPSSNSANVNNSMINGTNRTPQLLIKPSPSSSHQSQQQQPPAMIVDDDEEEAELTDDLLIDETSSQQLHSSDNIFHSTSSMQSDNESEPFTGTDVISIKLYHLLEIEIKNLQNQLSKKDSVIHQQAEEIKGLEGKLSILARKKVVKSGQETAEIQKQLKNTQSESKQREKQYRIQIHKLKSKLDDDN